jgi:hypothetical protein
VGLQALFYFSSLKNKWRKNKNVLASALAFGDRVKCDLLDYRKDCFTFVLF